MKTLLLTALMLLTLVAHAADLGAAKTQGLVGEQDDGYLGVVDSSAPADVRDLVESVNVKRRQESRPRYRRTHRRKECLHSEGKTERLTLGPKLWFGTAYPRSSASSNNFRSSIVRDEAELRG